MDMCDDWSIRMLRGMIIAHKPAAIYVNEWMAKEILYVMCPPTIRRFTPPPLPPLTSVQMVLMNFDGVWLIEDRAATQPVVLEGFMGKYAEIPKEAGPMMPYQKRVVDERAELKRKMTGLETFIESHAFMGVEHGEQLRLRRQLEIMGKYHDILTERMVAFGQGEKS